MRKCCVPGCHSNYGKPYVPTFLFPKDVSRRKLWEKNIGSPKLKISANIGVCVKHFTDDCVVRYDSYETESGTVNTVRRKVKLKQHAVPTIFPCDTDSKPQDHDQSKDNNIFSDKGMQLRRQRKRRKTVGSARNKFSPEVREAEPALLRNLLERPSTTNRPIITILKAEDMNDAMSGEGKEEDDDIEIIEEVPSSAMGNGKVFPDETPSTSTHDGKEDRGGSKGGSCTKRRSSSVGSNSSNGSNEVSKSLTPKRKKMEKNPPTVTGLKNDCYCWVCHKEGVTHSCLICPRAYHYRCANEPSFTEDWICPECEKMVCSSNTDGQSNTLKDISFEKFSSLLKSCVAKLKSRCPVAFHQPVPVSYYSSYLDYVIHPMDLSLIEKNIKQKQYGTTDAFLADVKWIVHNSCVFNGAQHPLSLSARNLVKIAEGDMAECEVCPDCFLHTCAQNKYWFSNVCEKPHPLVWAKLKGFPYWPAKVVRIADDNIDARFFGAHDRAWVPVAQCYHLSQEMPTTSKPKKKGNYETALEELQIHVGHLKKKYGDFVYAPYRTPFDVNNKFLMYHGIDIDRVSTKEESVKINSSGTTTTPITTVLSVNSAVSSKSFTPESVTTSESNLIENGPSETEGSEPHVKRALSFDVCEELKGHNQVDSEAVTVPVPEKKSLPAGVFEVSLDCDDLEKSNPAQPVSSEVSKPEELIFLEDSTHPDMESLFKLQNSVNLVTMEKESAIRDGDSESAKTSVDEAAKENGTEEVKSSNKLSIDSSEKSVLSTADLNSVEMERSASLGSILPDELPLKEKEAPKAIPVVKKNDSFSQKLDETIKSCFAKLGISDVSVDAAASSGDSSDEEMGDKDDSDEDEEDAKDDSDEDEEDAKGDSDEDDNEDEEESDSSDTDDSSSSENVSDDEEAEKHSDEADTSRPASRCEDGNLVDIPKECTQEDAPTEPSAGKEKIAISDDSNIFDESLSESKENASKDLVEHGSQQLEHSLNIGDNLASELVKEAGHTKTNNEEAICLPNKITAVGSVEEVGLLEAASEHSNSEGKSLISVDMESDASNSELEASSSEPKLQNGDIMDNQNESSKYPKEFPEVFKEVLPSLNTKNILSGKESNEQYKDSIQLQEKSNEDFKQSLEPDIPSNQTSNKIPDEGSSLLADENQMSTTAEQCPKENKPEDTEMKAEIVDKVISGEEEPKSKFPSNITPPRFALKSSANRKRISVASRVMKTAPKIIAVIDLSSDSDSEDKGEDKLRPLPAPQVPNSPEKVVVNPVQRDSVIDLSSNSCPSGKNTKSAKEGSSKSKAPSQVTSFANCLQVCNNKSDSAEISPSAVASSPTESKKRCAEALPGIAQKKQKITIEGDSVLPKEIITDLPSAVPSSQRAVEQKSEPLPMIKPEDESPNKNSGLLDEAMDVSLNPDPKEISKGNGSGTPEDLDDIILLTENIGTGGMTSENKGTNSAEPSPPTSQKKPTDLKTRKLEKEVKQLKELLHELRFKYEKRDWFSAQEMEELKYNMNLIILEMRCNLDNEKKAAIEESKKQLVKEKEQAVLETKGKQWCASCKDPAMFYCCWNTSYCSYSCQKHHWLEHRFSCTQIKTPPPLKSQTTEYVKIAKKPTAEAVDNRFLLVMKPFDDAQPAVLSQAVSSSSIASETSSVLTGTTTSLPSKMQLVTPKNPVQLVSTASQPTTALPFLTNQQLQFLLTPVKPAADKTPTSVSLVTKPVQDSADLVTKVRTRQTDLNTAISLLNKMNKETEETLKKKREVSNADEVSFSLPSSDIDLQYLEEPLVQSNMTDLTDISFSGDQVSFDDEALMIQDVEDTEDGESDSNSAMVSIGPGVELSEKKLKQCLKIGVTATKLARCLLMVFFSMQQLAQSSVFGRMSNVTKKTRPALSTDIVNAILSYVLQKFPGTQRTDLVLAMNLKCKEARKKSDILNNESKVVVVESPEGKTAKVVQKVVTSCQVSVTNNGNTLKPRFVVTVTKSATSTTASPSPAFTQLSKALTSTNTSSTLSTKNIHLVPTSKGVALTAPNKLIAVPHTTVQTITNPPAQRSKPTITIVKPKGATIITAEKAGGGLLQIPSSQVPVSKSNSSPAKPAFPPSTQQVIYALKNFGTVNEESSLNKTGSSKCSKTEKSSFVVVGVSSSVQHETAGKSSHTQESENANKE